MTSKSKPAQESTTEPTPPPVAVRSNIKTLTFAERAASRAAEAREIERVAEAEAKAAREAVAAVHTRRAEQIEELERKREADDIEARHALALEIDAALLPVIEDFLLAPNNQKTLAICSLLRSLNVRSLEMVGSELSWHRLFFVVASVHLHRAPSLACNLVSDPSLFLFDGRLESPSQLAADCLSSSLVSNIGRTREKLENLDAYFWSKGESVGQLSPAEIIEANRAWSAISSPDPRVKSAFETERKEKEASALAYQVEVAGQREFLMRENMRKPEHKRASLTSLLADMPLDLYAGL